MDKIFDYSKELCTCEVAKLKNAPWLATLATLLKCTRNCVARILLVREETWPLRVPLSLPTCVFLGREASAQAQN